MENPLEDIKNIQLSLEQMKARLQHLSKTEVKNIENISKTFMGSLSLIRSKFDDCRNAERKSEQLAIKEVLNNSKMQTLKQHKFNQEKQLTRSREILTAMKFNESQQIKTMTRHNEKIIEKIKSHQVEEKKRRRMQMKENREKSRQKINQFHALKYDLIDQNRKQALREQRQKETKDNQLRAVKLAKQVSAMGLQQEKVLNRYKESSQILQKLRFAVKKIEKMKTNQFSRLKGQMGLSLEAQVNEELAQKLLNEIVIGGSPSKSKSSYQ